MYEASYSGPEADIRVTDEDPKIALSVCAFRIATESIETPVDRPGYPISWEDRLEWMNELFRDHGSPGDDLPAYIRLEDHRRCDRLTPATGRFEKSPRLSII